MLVTDAAAVAKLPRCSELAHPTAHSDQGDVTGAAASFSPGSLYPSGHRAAGKKTAGEGTRRNGMAARDKLGSRADGPVRARA